MIKLLLVDDDPNVLWGLRMRLALESDITIVGEANDGAAAVAKTVALHPDVVVMDIQMPVMDGIAAAGALHATAPETAVIVLSIHDDAATRAEAARSGVRSFVGKHQSVDTLVAAIREVIDPHPPASLSA
jgi:DNA-binding NarL/FixJ family response regulator